MSRAATSSSKKAAATAPPAMSVQTKATAPGQSSLIREVKPTVEQIRARAYQFYVERTARGDRGDAATDWIRAERELSQKLA